MIFWLWVKMDSQSMHQHSSYGKHYVSENSNGLQIVWLSLNLTKMAIVLTGIRQLQEK